MADDCITIESGCEIEIIEAETCDVEVIEVGGGGGGTDIGVIAVDLTVHVTVTGDDVLGDGTIANPFASTNRALQFIDNKAIMDGAHVTISVGAGDFDVTETLKLYNPKPEVISIVGADLLGSMITAVHYVPRDGAYPGIGSTNKFLVTSRGNGFSDAPTNKALIEATFATRFIFNGDNFTGDSAVEVHRSLFPSMSKIAFINDGQEAGNSYIQAGFDVQQFGKLNLSGDCAIFGFNNGVIAYESSDITFGKLAIAGQFWPSVSIDNSKVTALTNLVSAGGDDHGIEISNNGLFYGPVFLAGFPTDGVSLENHSVLESVNVGFGDMLVYGCNSAAVTATDSKFATNQSSFNVYDCEYGVFGFKSTISIPKATFEKLQYDIVFAKESFVRIGGSTITNDGTAEIYAQDGSVILTEFLPSYVTTFPPLNTIDASGNRVIDVNATELILSDAKFENVTYKVVDLAAGSAMDTANGVAFKKTITANTTFTLTFNKGEGQFLTLYLDNAGAFAHTFTGVTWLSGVPPVFNVAGKDILNFFSDGVTVFGEHIGAGQTNTSSNVGIGLGLALTKVGSDLPFKSLTSDAIIALTSTSTTVNIAVVEGNINHQSIGGAGSNTHADLDQFVIDATAAINGKEPANANIQEHIAKVTNENPHNTTLEGARSVDNQLAGAIDFNNNEASNVSGISFQAGETATWDGNENTIDVPSGLGNSVKVGQTNNLMVYNNTGVLITKGSVISIIPGFVTGGRPHVELAVADTHVSQLIRIYIAASDIGIASAGVATQFGKVSGFDTSAWPVGFPVWLDPDVAGSYTNVPPDFPNYRIGLAVITESHATTGSLFCDIVTDLDDTFRNFWNGVFRESFTFSISSDGAIVTGTLAPVDNNPDMTMIFSDGFSLFDTSPPYEITLTPGTDLAPSTRYIYVLQSTKLMVEGAGWPATEHIKIAIVSLRSAATTQTNGSVNQNINDAIMDNGQGHLTHITERLRKEGTAWEVGTEGLVTLVTASTPDDVFVSVTGGKVYQLHLQDFQSFDQATGDLVHILNHPTTPFIGVSNLNTQLVDALNITLNNRAFSFVLWGAVNSVDDSHLLLNLPTGSYDFNAISDAINDPLNHSVYTIPPQFVGAGFLIARFTFTYKNDVWTLEATEDLRGAKPNIFAGGGVGGSGVTTWLGLTDTPVSYIDSGNLYPKVNAGETGIEFFNLDAVVDSKVSKVLTGQQIMAGELVLPDATLAALDELVNANSVVDVFLYIPSVMDDDNGAWIDAANWQSWYHEPLNTTQRGATRAFPKQALIIAEANKLIIYDASDADLPMWISFNTVGWNGGHLYSGGASISSVKVLNGELLVATLSGFNIIRFLEDETQVFTSVLGWGGFSKTPISERNNSSNYSLGTDNTVPVIISSVTNEVAVTSDGSGNNLVYVGTDGGVSRIAFDGTVSNWTDTYASTNVVRAIAILNDIVIFMTNTTVNAIYGWQYPVGQPLSTDVWNDRALDGTTTFGWDTGRITFGYEDTSSIVKAMVRDILGSSRGLTKLYPNADDWGQSMLANITNTFNSGVLHGDIRGAWLADTEAGTIGVDESTELVTNGTFNTDLNSWTIADNIAWSSDDGGVAQATIISALSNVLTQNITTVVGKHYIFSVDWTLTAGAGTQAIIVDNLNVKTLVSGTTTTYDFLATVTSTRIDIQLGDTISGNIDNITVKQTGNLVVNGDFETALGVEWVEFNTPILLITAGVLRITNGASAFGSAVQSFTTVIGKTYALSLDVIDTSVTTASLRVSTNDASGGTGDIIDVPGTLAENETHIFTFIAITTTTFVRLFGNGVLNDFVEFDNVSVRLADADRSYNNNALATIGTVPKTPVAIGAELVGYGPYSNLNYQKQEYNVGVDFGASKFFIDGWFNVGADGLSSLMSFGTSGGTGFVLDITSSGLQFILNDGTNFTATLAEDFTDDIWRYFEILRDSDGVLTIVVDRVHILTTSNRGQDISNVLGTLKIGVNNTLGSAFAGSLALIRVSGTLPTPEQSDVTYANELRIMQPDSKCTLQGTSSNVVAVDYDEISNIVTACAGDTITKFNGLQAIESRTETATSVSTVNNKEVTGV